MQILLAALLFSTGGAAIKGCSLSSWQVASFRSGIAAAAVLLMMPEARRRFGVREIVVGAGYAATLILFVTANKLTTAANTIFLQSTAPLYILLLGPWLLREPTRRRDVALIGALAVGMAILFASTEAPVVTAPDPALGNVLAALAGVFWALTVTGLRFMGRAETAVETPRVGTAGAAVAAGNLIAFLVCLPLALPVGQSRNADWAILAYLGVFQIGVAYVSLTAALRHVRALDASLLLMIEPVLNPFWAWLVHGETPGPGSLVGGAIILGATAVKTLRR